MCECSDWCVGSVSWRPVPVCQQGPLYPSKIYLWRRQRLWRHVRRTELQSVVYTCHRHYHIRCTSTIRIRCVFLIIMPTFLRTLHYADLCITSNIPVQRHKFAKPVGQINDRKKYNTVFFGLSIKQLQLYEWHLPVAAIYFLTFGYTSNQPRQVSGFTYYSRSRLTSSSFFLTLSWCLLPLSWKSRLWKVTKFANGRQYLQYSRSKIKHRGW